MKARKKSKTFFVKLVCGAMAAVCAFSFSACGKEELYSGWEHDEEYHWRYNSKGEVVDKNIHNFLWWRCTLCGYTKDPPEEKPAPELPEEPPIDEPSDEPAEDDEPIYDEPLPEDPWQDPVEDEPTDEPETPPEEEPEEDEPENPPQDEPEEEPPQEDPPQEEEPKEEEPKEEPPKEDPKPQTPTTPSKPSTPSTPSKPSKPTLPSYESGSDWSDWPEDNQGSGGTGGTTQGGEGTGGSSGAAGGGNTSVQPNEKAQEFLIYTPIQTPEGEIVAYSVKADPDRNKNSYIEIPDFHLEKPVTVIEKEGFKLKTLKTIRLSTQATTIEYEAFAGSSLTEIYIPNSVTTIEDRAFCDCTSLKKVRLPINDEYIKIQYELFHNCTALSRIVIPDSVKTIATRAFEYARMQSLVVGRGVTAINNQAFNESRITQGICIYDLVKWCNIKIDSQIASPLYWGHRLFIWENNKATELKELVVPEEITELGRFQFGGCTSIEKVDMSNVTSVKDEVFIHCTSIESVILPEHLPEFTSNLFYHCSSLKEITVPEGITQIPYCCFYNCESLETINLPGSINYFGSLSISGCKSLKKIKFNGTKEQWDKIYNRDGWMWFSGTGNFVIECTDKTISKTDDQKRYDDPFEIARKEMEEKYGTGAAIVEKRRG